MMLLAAVSGKSPATISSAWNDLSVTHPTTTDTTGARTITFTGPSRTITNDGESIALALEYSINGGGYVAYTTGFSFTSGDTLQWRGTFSADSAGNCNVYVDGILLDTFAKTATGFP